MFWSFCSSKGGVGTSVVAASFASELATAGEDRVVLLDMCGAQPDICGVDVSGVQGVVDWLYAGEDVGAEALENLLVEISPGLYLLPRGTRALPSAPGQIDPDRLGELIRSVGDMVVVADIGVIDMDPLSPRALLIAGSDSSVVVVRSCYLALRQLARIPVVVDGIIEVVEAGRSLRTIDVEAVAAMPVTARIRVDPTIARSVDAGLVLRRTPRALRRMAADVRGELSSQSLVPSWS